MSDANPYLSIIATTRNDDHGGGLNRRTQAFIDGVASQARRFRLRTELLIVEWNPPADRPPLREVFRWPHDNPWCEVRIVTVPRQVHARYRYGDQLPMLQMIAKNVGIRRAHGEFVLTTNVDILFSDELFAFLAERRLDPNALYRSDRVDADRHVPLNVPIEEQLAHCRHTVLRISRKGGMWFVPEDSPARTVEFALPVAYTPPVLPPRGRARQSVAPPPPPDQGAVGPRPKPPISFVPRLKDLARRARASLRHKYVRLRAFVQAVADRPYADEAKASGYLASLAHEAMVVFSMLVGSVLLFVRGLTRGVVTYIRSSFVADYVRRLRSHLAQARSVRDRLRAMGYRPTPSELLDELLITSRSRAIPHLHTHACGDFMLAHRDAWSRMRGSPELVMYSLHLDSLTIMSAYKLGIKIEELPGAMVHYHIEHGNGWTPEHELQLYRRMNERGIRILTYGQYLRYATYLLRIPQHFLSQEDWGLGSMTLSEETVTGRKFQPIRGDEARVPEAQIAA